MRQFQLLLSAILFCCIFSSCFDFKNNLNYINNPVRDEAYVPVYSNDSASSRIVSEEVARPTTAAGKIYVQGNLLFQVEKLAGVHVINYADVQHPVKIAFIKSRGCNEVAYKNGYLIINNMDDLVFIDARDPAHIKEASRLQHAFNNFYVDQYPNNRPPLTGKYYVCPDYTKGDIIGWKLEKNVSGAYCN